MIPELIATGAAVIDQGPDFRLRRSRGLPALVRLRASAPRAARRQAVYGLPELHRARSPPWRRRPPAAIVGSPGCYPTATLLALAPLARAGLIGDLVVDAKSGVSGAGRDPKADLTFGEVNESVKAYGIGGAPPRRGDRAGADRIAGADGEPRGRGVDFLPHLIPMTRGILSACHVRPTRPVTAGELDALYAEAYAASRS
jgi:N-acetyl-gamma-glutamyl-phosphate reductase